MKENKSLAESKNSTIRIRKILNNVFEFIKSKVRKDYVLSENSPAFLMQNKDLILRTQDIKLVLNYYKNLLNNHNVNILLSNNILTPGLLGNKGFLKDYIMLLTSRGIDSDIIVNTLTRNDDCVQVFKKDLSLFDTIIEYIPSIYLNKLFSKFFSNEELNELFANNNSLSEKLLHISQLYARDSDILEALDVRLLKEQYQNIPDYKIPVIARNSTFQKKLLSLNNFQYSIYSRLTELVSQKTKKWNRFEQNIVYNLSDGYYQELVNDLYEQAKRGNKITSKNLETLTFLLSQTYTLKSTFDNYWAPSYRKQGLDEESIKEHELEYSNNIFNITTKNELEHFDEIKELVCDTVLANPNLDDAELTTSINKYLGKFRQLSELDRIELSLLEKYYNMDLKEASIIVKSFSSDVDSIPTTDEYQASVIEQIKGIKNIFESNNINTLMQISDLNMLVKTDLSTTTLLIEQSKELYEQLYKKGLYMPKSDEKIHTATYNGKDVDVYDAGSNFSMIIKKIKINEHNSQKLWNRLVSLDFFGQKHLRYNTSTSYMTDENLARRTLDSIVILGFADGISNCSIDAIFPQDAHTDTDLGDSVYEDFNSSYIIPSSLETNTDNNYNELIINTLAIDSMSKMQPDYIVYIKDKKYEEDLEKDPLWENSKRIASEFGIPIVIVDKEKVKESEKSKIESLSRVINEDSSGPEILRFVKKVEHYTSRYSANDILEFAPADKLDALRRCLKQKELEEKNNISLPNLGNEINIGNATNRQSILDRQTELMQEI